MSKWGRSAVHREEPGGAASAGPAWPQSLALAAGAGLAMGAAYAADASAGTAAALLSGMALAAWQFHRSVRSRRWACLGLSLALWQLGGMGWITSVLAPELAGPERLLATALLFTLLWAVSLGSLLLLAGAAQRLLPARAAELFALPLAWWGWMALRDLWWWGGAYGGLGLPLLALPGLSTLLPLLGPALFEALLWAALLSLTRPAAPGARGRAAMAAALGLTLACPAPWRWTAPAGEGLAVAAVQAPIQADRHWTFQNRDAALDALHDTLRRAPPGALIVTPEVFLPEPPPQTAEGVWGDLLAALEERHQRLLLGTALRPAGGAVPDLMNVALLLTPQDSGGVAHSVYAKQRLAPVGEELPWPALLAPVADRWLNHARRPGRSHGSPELAEPLLVNGTTVGLLICHEVAFGDLPASTAESLIHMASGTWTDDPRAGRQALGLARLRAMEAGKWLLTVSDGRGAQLIDPQGGMRVARGVDLLPARQGRTPYVRWRHLQLPALGLLLAALLLVRCRRGPAPRFPTLAGSQP